MLELKFEIPLVNSEPKVWVALSKVRPQWKSEDVSFKNFTEGLMNKLLGCINHLSPKDIVLIKIHGRNSELFVDHEKEKLNYKVLSQIGLSTPLYACFQNGLIYGFSHGSCPSIDESLSAPVGPQIAAMMAKYHRSHPPHLKCEPFLWKAFNLFIKEFPYKFKNNDIQQRYNSLLPSKKELLSEINWLRGVIENLNSPIVFCHNDLSLTNIIYNKEKKEITFIDLEMAHYNYQGFDLGHFFAFNLKWGTNAEFRHATDEEIIEWLKDYLKHLDDGDASIKRINLLLKHTRHFHMAAHLLWTIWSISQVENSIIDYDYLGYSRCRLNAFYEIKKSLFPTVNS